MNYVGSDHHRQDSHITVMDQMGQVLRSGRVPNLQDEIEKFLIEDNSVALRNSLMGLKGPHCQIG